MKLTYVLEHLKPTRRKENILLDNISEVVENRKSIAEQLQKGNKKLSTSNFNENLPSCVVNQNIREVKVLYNNFKKSNSPKTNLNFKANQPICYNNQNYSLDLKNGFISVPLWNGKSTRINFPIKFTPRHRELEYQLIFGAKRGKGSLFYKKGKWYFAVTITIEPIDRFVDKTMGIDIGIRHLAVASILNKDLKETNRKFYSGNEAGFVRKKFRTVRRKLGKNKKLHAIRKLNNKEQRWMTDKNHKISRSLVNLAVQEGVGVIVMEKLSGIRNKVKSIKKADRNIHSWSFYQLQQFIEYKAKLAGIEVRHVDAKYTSQICSKCGQIKRSNRRGNLYTCSCGNRIHADLNAAKNIAKKFESQLKQSA